jgi:hypothetical protein
VKWTKNCLDPKRIRSYCNNRNYKSSYFHFTVVLFKFIVTRKKYSQQCTTYFKLIFVEVICKHDIHTKCRSLVYQPFVYKLMTSCINMMIYCLINDIINEERKSCTKEIWVKKTSIIFICDEFKAIMQLWQIVVIVQWYWIVLLVQIGLPEEIIRKLFTRFTEL